MGFTGVGEGMAPVEEVGGVPIAAHCRDSSLVKGGAKFTHSSIFTGRCPSRVRNKSGATVHNCTAV